MKAKSSVTLSKPTEISGFPVLRELFHRSRLTSDWLVWDCKVRRAKYFEMPIKHLEWKRLNLRDKCDGCAVSASVCKGLCKKRLNVKLKENWIERIVDVEEKVVQQNVKY